MNAKTVRHDLKTARSALMARVGSKNTRPELVVRKIIHMHGFRFRLHRRDLPGTPDIVLPRLKKVIFVNGCFWHRHPGCKKATTPKTRVEFWQSKFDKNVERDIRNKLELSGLGWNVATVWECETKNISGLSDRLFSWLSEHSSEESNRSSSVDN